MRLRGSLLALTLSGIYFLSLLFLIGVPPIADPSEAREAHVAHIVYSTGEWVLPTRNGIIPSKPPLYHWITASLAGLFGEVTPFCARVTSLLFASGVIFLTALLAQMLSRTIGHDEERAASISFLSAAVLSLTYGFTQVAGDCRVDMTYTFFVVSALFVVFRKLTPPQSPLRCLSFNLKKKDIYIFFCCAGFAVLAKGPIGLGLPLLIAFSCVAATHGLFTTVRQFFFNLPAWILFFLIAAPWYILAYYQGGSAFVEKQVVFENVMRVVGGEFVNSFPWWFYIPSFLRCAFPWSIIFICLVYSYALMKRESPLLPTTADRERGVFFVFFLWFAAGFLFFSFCSGKRHSYLLPLFPAMSIAVAWGLVDGWHRAASEERRKWLERGTCGAAALPFLSLGFLSLLEAFRAPIHLSPYFLEETRQWILSVVPRLEWVLLCGAIASCGAVLGKWRTSSSRPLLVWASILIASCSTMALGAGIKNSLSGYEGMANRINTQVSSKDALYVVKFPKEEFYDTLFYYLRREASPVFPDIAGAPCEANMVARRKWYEEFRSFVLPRGKTVVELGRYNHLYEAARQRTQREFVLFRCAEGLRDKAASRENGD